MNNFIFALILIAINPTFSLGAELKDKPEKIVGLGFGIGFRNSNGFGGSGFYRLKNIEGNIGMGFTAYNGTKFSLGGKYYFFNTQNRKIIPFISLNFTQTLAEDVTDNRDPHEEVYIITNNQYGILGLGAYIANKKKTVEHHFSLGYTYSLNKYSVIPYYKNTRNDLYDPILNSIQGGLMLSYTCCVSIFKYK